MGFLKRRDRQTYRDSAPAGGKSSFQGISSAQLDEHLSVSRYGSFVLTDAIRPAFNLAVVPSAGWRKNVYEDTETGIKVPVVMASQTRHKLFELFLDLLDPLGAEVDVVLETSHNLEHEAHQDLYREHIELPVLQSILADYEDLLLHDGCTGIAVLNSRVPMEVQFDEHKQLIMYGHDLEPFIDVLHSHDLYQSETLRFMSEAEHIHSSLEEHVGEFEGLVYRLGLES
ncbi:MAG: hypothetical protein KDA88_06020 [Planctomycetaceae bacterium]|nr:hypothetical protein [Planctomycetaceae bacterium]MCB9950582.1 hypothetical protein [Planctomycetaceae bacterium]